MDPGISSVSLGQMTPIIAILASGTAIAIFIAITERLIFWKGTALQITNYKLQITKHQEKGKNAESIKYFFLERMLLKRFKRDDTEK
jgi:hypothetical protein